MLLRVLSMTLVVIVILAAVLLGGAYWLVLHMPGESYRAAPSPLTAEEAALRDRLREHVQVLAGEIGERNYWAPEALRAAADYIEQTFQEAGHEVFRQGIPTREKVFHNIEVRIPGADPQQEILVVGAHYDTVVGSPGADDNASGVAVLLELARLLSDARLERSIHLVAFVNEEAPFFGTEEMGSLQYAHRARANQEPIVGMIALEMLGYYTDAPGSQEHPPLLDIFYPDTGDFLAFVGNLDSRALVRETIGAFRADAEVPSEGLAAPEFVEAIRRSDHWAFWEMGYPALMLTDTANFRNPHYHQPTDTPDTLDYDTLTRVTTALTHTLQTMAQR